MALPRRAARDCRLTGLMLDCRCMAKRPRATPAGFRKTSYEMQDSVKRSLGEITSDLDFGGYPGVSETVVVEALILTAKRDGVDRKVLDRILRARQTAAEKARS